MNRKKQQWSSPPKKKLIKADNFIEAVKKYYGGKLPKNYSNLGDKLTQNPYTGRNSIRMVLEGPTKNGKRSYIIIHAIEIPSKKS